MHNKFSNCFVWVNQSKSFAVIKIEAPNIWQEFPLKKYVITKRSGRATVTLNFKASG